MKRLLPLVLAAAVPMVAWGVLFIERLSNGYVNIDDFLYAGQAQAYYTGARNGPTALVQAWQAYGNSAPLVPTLTVPLTKLTSDPNVLVAVQLLFLAALFAGVVVLAQSLGRREAAAWWVAAVVCCLPPVLGYAVMLHFALAASAATVWCLACYLRSDRLRSRRWTVALGVAGALLSLSRVLSVVYLAAVVVVIGVDLLLDRTEVRARAINGMLALVVGLAVALPWWWAAGYTAIHYLLYAGYDSSSGYVPHRPLLTHVVERFRHTADETGTLLAGVLLVAFVVALAADIRSRSRPAVLVSALALLIFAGLSTSTDLGTSFGQPAVVLMAVVCLASSYRLSLGTAAVALLAALALLLPVDPWGPAGEQVWLSGTPGFLESEYALRGGGPGVTQEQALHQVLDVTKGRRTLLIRDDAIVNANGLKYFNPFLDLTDVSYGAQQVSPADLQGFTAVIAGIAAPNYHQQLHSEQVNAALLQAGFRLARTITLSRTDIVEVWLR